jgi:hypothetical protein
MMSVNPNIQSINIITIIGSSMVCFKDVYNSGGIRSFYKGFGITVFRSICANITCLSVYENLHHFGYSYLE